MGLLHEAIQIVVVVLQLVHLVLLHGDELQLLMDRVLQPMHQVV